MSGGTPVLALPLWAELATALLVLIGAACAAIGSFGLVRLPTFLQRVHAPAVGSTLGVWALSLATIVYFSAQGDHLFLHAVLIVIFVGLTAPVSTIFLMRAALFRSRQKSRASAAATSQEQPGQRAADERVDMPE